MRVPTHQIHNVLNAYAKRLKKMHETANRPAAENVENRIHTYSVEEKRRLIINKISSDIVERIARSTPRPRSVKTSTLPNGPAETTVTPPPELTRYHILTKSGKKVAATLKIMDSDYLIKQLEEIARSSK